MKMKYTLCALFFLLSACYSGSITSSQYHPEPIYKITTRYVYFINDTPLILEEKASLYWQYLSEYTDHKKWDLTLTNAKTYYSNNFAMQGKTQMETSLTEGGASIYNLVNEIEIQNGESIRNITNKVDIKATSQGILIENKHGRYLLTSSKLNTEKKLLEKKHNLKISNLINATLYTYYDVAEQWSPTPVKKFNGFEVSKYIELGFMFGDTITLYSCKSSPKKK